MEMHDFLDTHDGFHFLIGFWSIFAKRNDSSGFPYGMLHISAPAFIPGAVFDDGKLGSQTAQKTFPRGVGYGEDKRVGTACTREKHGFMIK